MIVLVTGGRTYGDRPSVFQVLDALHADTPITLLIEGGARGADALAREWAARNHVAGLTFAAKWDEEGKAAGPRRNARMLREGNPSLVVAFAGGRGTRDMKAQARTAGVRVLDVTAPTCPECEQPSRRAGYHCPACQLDYNNDEADALVGVPLPSQEPDNGRD